MQANLQLLLLLALPFIFAITMQEAAMAYAADYFGDPTARQLGRRTFNPLVHIHPVGTLLVPAALFLLTGGSFMFGYAKPIPFDFGRMRNPRRQLGWVSLAGPAMNLAMAWGWAAWGLALPVIGMHESFFIDMAKGGVWVNLFLLVFNLIPLPPFAGGRILIGFLPDQLAIKLAQVEKWTFFIVLALIATSMLSFWTKPMLALAGFVLNVLIYPLKILLN